MKDAKRGQENTLTFDIYRTKDGLYAKENICLEYDIGDNQDVKQILNGTCYKVDEKELNSLEKKLKKDKIKFEPKYKQIFETQLILSFTVYVDSNHNKDLYISNSLCMKYGVDSKKKRYINGALHCLVSNEDIEKIERITKDDNILLRKKYTVVELENTDYQMLENIFIYYYDMETKTMYVQRNIYEIAKDLNINIEGKPKIINDKNCYSITESELKDIETCIQKKGVEKIIRPKIIIKSSDDSESTRDKDIEAILNSMKEKTLIKEKTKKEEEKGESKMNMERIEGEMFDITGEERRAVRLLGDPNVDIDEIKEALSLYEENLYESNERIVRLLGDPNVDLDEVRSELNKILEGNQKVMKTLGLNYISMERVKEDLRRLTAKSHQIPSKIDIEKIKNDILSIINRESEVHIVRLLGDQSVVIEEVKEDLRRYLEDASEKHIVRLLGNHNIDIEEIKRELRSHLEEEAEEQIVKLLGDQNVDIEAIKQELSNYEDDNIVILLGNQNVDINGIKEDLLRQLDESAGQHIVKLLGNVSIDIDRLKTELETYLKEEEERYIIKLLGDRNVDIDAIKEELNKYTEEEARRGFVKLLGDRNIDVNLIRSELNEYVNEQADQHLVVLIGDPNIDLNEVKRQLNSYIQEESEHYFVQLLGDQNVDIYQIKDELQLFLNELEETHIVRLLGDQNVDIEEIKRELNRHLIECTDHYIVKILGDQNIDIYEVKQELMKYLSEEADENLVVQLGDLDVDVEEIKNNLKDKLEEISDRNIVKLLGDQNVDLNAVKVELLSNLVQEPAERSIVRILGDQNVDIEEIKNSLASQLVEIENENVVKLLGDPFVDLDEIRREMQIHFEDAMEKVFVYREKDTGKLFIEEKYGPEGTEKKVIHGRPCVETDMIQVRTLSDKKVIIVSVNEEEEKTVELDVVVCNADGKLFVSQDVLNSLDMYAVDPHKIIVNKEIYVEITKDDLEIIRSKDSGALKINIILKHITPVKG